MKTKKIGICNKKSQILKRKHNLDACESYISDVTILLKCHSHFLEGPNHGPDLCIYGSYGGFSVHHECFKGIG